MYGRAAITALFLQAVLRAVPQRPDAAPAPFTLKATSHVVELDVSVSDSSGRPVHGLKKTDFVVTDNGHPRDIRIFAGEIDTNRKMPASGATPAPRVYSNRIGMRDSPIVTAIVLDAIPRPAGLQKNTGRFANFEPKLWFKRVSVEALDAIYRMEPGEMIAIYAACPSLRIVQDYTSDPGRLVASLEAFVPPPLSDAFGKRQPSTVDALVPPMLSVLREVATRMSGASGRKSVVWISQAYGTELKQSAIGEATDSTINAFNNANVPLYAVDARFSPTCEPPADIPEGRASVVALTCSQSPDISDDWMESLARSTGGRAFSGGNVDAVQERDAQGKLTWGRYGMQGDEGLVSEAIRFAIDGSRAAYEIGFYVSESELDGSAHSLRVTIPAKPKYELRYRSGYTASAGETAPPTSKELGAKSDSNPQPASPVEPDQVGIDASIQMAAKAKNELRVSLALAPETVTRTADDVIVLDATFLQTDASGKQLAKVQETVQVPSPATQTDMVRYARGLTLTKGAVLLQVRIRDQATNRTGSIAIPIGNH